MTRLSLTGLLKIELPASTVLLCDGAFISWGGDTYKSLDPVWGTISAVDGLEEGVGQTLPALDLTFLPPAATGPGDVCDPDFQGSRVRMWLAEWVPATGLVSGTPVPMFDGVLDQVSWSAGRASRSFTVSVVTRAEWLFRRNYGNSLAPAFHKKVWPGETGEDNATGLSAQVAWGVEAPPQAVAGAPTAPRPRANL